MDSRRRPAKDVFTITRYVTGPDVTLRLARDNARGAAQHQLVAPTLLRSHRLSLLHRAVRNGELAWSEADARFTFDAEYVAPTQLHADAFVTLDVTLDAALARAVQGVVVLAAFDELLAPQ